MNAPNLDGMRVWVTRPAHQAEGLRTVIEAAGGHALCQPLLAIAPPSDPRAARAALAAAETADDLIFTSVNAVAWAWKLRPAFAPAGRIAAIGRATARALEAALGRPALAPASDYSSEGLLALPEFAAPAGRAVAVVTAEGGRNRLQSVLAERGAAVAEALVYRRRRVPLARGRLGALLDQADAIVITSGEALAHLVEATPAALAARLRSLQLVVPSSRVLKLAQDHDFVPVPLRPARMDDAAVVAALAQLASREGSASR